MSVSRGTRGAFQTWELSSSDARAEVCPERGALVTRFQARGDEVLFLDEASFLDPAKNVRGGVPLLFPVAGPAPQGSKLAQHGFARRLPWSAEAAGETVRLTLDASDETRAVWPHEFLLEYTVELTGARLELRWLVHNRGGDPMPLHFGLHPYFRVPPEAKAKVRVETQASRAYDNRTRAFGPAPAIDFSAGEVDVHLLDHAAKGTVLHRGDGSSVPLQWSQGFETLVLWTLPGSAFVCVEPWSGPSVPALEGERPLLAPGGSASFAFLIG